MRKKIIKKIRIRRKPKKNIIYKVCIQHAFLEKYVTDYWGYLMREASNKEIFSRKYKEVTWTRFGLKQIDKFIEEEKKMSS